MRSIIYNDLNESNFITKKHRFNFYFSSEFNQRRFEEKVDDYVSCETVKLNQRYKVFDKRFNQAICEMLMICFYKKIEKRGFLVYDKTQSNFYKEVK